MCVPRKSSILSLTVDTWEIFNGEKLILYLSDLFLSPTVL
jgi:hypothetical protein